MKRLATSIEVLAVMRHGDYEAARKYNYKDGSLTENSRIGVNSTSQQLRDLLGTLGYLERGKSIIVSSDKIRAKETADIVSSVSGLTCLSFAALGLDGRGNAYDSDEIMDALRNIVSVGGGYNGLVVVTHEEQTQWLPRLLHPKIENLQNRLHYACSVIYDSEGRSKTIYPKT